MEHGLLTVDLLIIKDGDFPWPMAGVYQRVHLTAMGSAIAAIAQSWGQLLATTDGGIDGYGKLENWVVLTVMINIALIELIIDYKFIDRELD